MKIADPNSGSQLWRVADGKGACVNSPRDDVVDDDDAKTNFYPVPSWMHITLLQRSRGNSKVLKSKLGVEKMYGLV